MAISSQTRGYNAEMIIYLENKNSELENYCANLIETINNWMNRYGSAIEEIKALHDAIDASEKERKKLEIKTKSLMSSLEAKRSEVSTYQNLLYTTRRTVMTWNMRYREQKNKNTELEQDNRKLHSLLDQEIDNCRYFISKNDSLKDEIKTLHDAIDASEKERKELRKECDELTEELEAYKFDRNVVGKEYIKKLEEEVKYLKNVIKSDAKEYSDKLDKLESTLKKWVFRTQIDINGNIKSGYWEVI